MYKFQPIFKQLIWGGSRILSFKQVSSHLHEVGESWELSAVPGNLSVVADGPEQGMTIVELILETLSCLLFIFLATLS